MSIPENFPLNCLAFTETVTPVGTPTSIVLGEIFKLEAENLHTWARVPLIKNFNKFCRWTATLIPTFNYLKTIWNWKSWQAYEK